MTIDTEKNPSTTPGAPGTMKSIQNAIAKATRLSPSKTEKAAPPLAAIEIKAYEIWMSRGQEHGHDQEHWFEAERQLRQS